jgi:8-oxo-dGTP pyrophosphatase MutT (NUDIX family)/phosphohistidine phosphatase SixA
VARHVDRIEAAGGVLWRAANPRTSPEVDPRTGIEIALVHRPGRDSWSLPKGKLEPDEHSVMAALREVHEETGFLALLGPALGSTDYLKGGVPKRVRYWSMRASGGEFTPNAEIDDLVWVPLDAAAQLARRRDVPVIERFERRDAHRSRPLVLVPPASVRGKGWRGRERRRPLDRRGWRQATALAGLIQAYGIRRALAADARCCAETLRPFENDSDVEHEAILPVRGKGAEIRAAVESVVEVAQQSVPTVVCAEQRVLARLTYELTAGEAEWRRRISRLPDGSLCVLHLSARPDRRDGCVVRAERIRPAV